ncbi:MULTISPECIES: MFS transporter [unclassified Duganella]|uniref:MFS transporter n=1 Tax=unclassified Duganella TaxID=2636909 RepID=UPI000874CCE9|nr:MULTISPECIES: MFS transporter [unclassified Duganella]OEZ58558.1 major facilitator superfamily protein [Duganella sp. HH105]OFA04496.1 major facilitator superfamily protein [Duganella sp. HH101]
MHSSSNKPILSFWQLWNMSFGFFGIQFGFALQNANVSRIFSTLGANPDDLSLFWLAAPVTGLLVQPIIGYLSDNTWHPTWGRRRPFFFIGALLASIALFLMPNSSALWMAVVVLWLLDGAINVSMEPFRAFVGDKLGPSQQTAGFAMQTFFIGWGAVIASLLPTIFTHLGVSNLPVGGAVPDTVRYSFYSGGAIYFLAVLWTVLAAKETPPEDMEAFRADQRRGKGLVHALKEILGGFTRMPKTMVQLAAVQFFSWIALFAMWIYTTNAIGENVFGTTDAQSVAYQNAGNHVGVMFAVYSGVSALAAFVLPMFARRTSRKFVHMSCLTIGGVSLFSIYAIHDLNMLFVPMIGVGIAWASILTMPYAILAGALPAKRMGYYMGVFNFFITIPQIVSGVLLGFITKHWFAGHPIKTLMLGGVCMAVAGVLTLAVRDQADPVGH